MISRSARARAFTLVEMSVATGIFALLGLIVYGVASEGLYAFSRNISINRSYSEARRAMDRISNLLQTSGFSPLQCDAAGAPTTATRSAGIRFWRYSNAPCYDISTPALTDKYLTLKLYAPGSSTVLLTPPLVGDMITISSLGFQAKVTSVTSVTATSAVLNFAGTVDDNSSAKTIPPSVNTTTNKGTNTTTIQYCCMAYTPVAVIAVGTQLRYYPRFIYGTTDIETAANYKVLTNLVSTVGGATAPLPFSLGTFPSVNVDIFAEAPDYNNRNLGTANTYTHLQTAFSSRNPALLNAPY